MLISGVELGLRLEAPRRLDGVFDSPVVARRRESATTIMCLANRVGTEKTSGGW